MEATAEARDMEKERAGESRNKSMEGRVKGCRRLIHGKIRNIGKARKERMWARHQRHHGCNSCQDFTA